MKKVLLVLMSFLLFGCAIGNTPSSKVELFLNNYNNLTDDVLLDIEKSALNENLNDSNKELYKNVLAKQYENMKYEIKDESIDGNTAIVTVNINVYDMYKGIMPNGQNRKISTNSSGSSSVIDTLY